MAHTRTHLHICTAAWARELCAREVHAKVKRIRGPRLCRYVRGAPLGAIRARITRARFSRCVWLIARVRCRRENAGRVIILRAIFVKGEWNGREGGSAYQGYRTVGGRRSVGYYGNSRAHAWQRRMDCFWEGESGRGMTRNFANRVIMLVHVAMVICVYMN